ncbi:hypothetical protein LCGC14_2007010 [marine sediment metagenome]|uniref:Uncharacterized protein n=1 Tax=marine sediment metagenome TaxID=412755 RepID=A0A0F9HYI2_9ZZZZ
MGDMHDDVKRRLEDAGRTLMMLPMPADGMPAGNRAAWPDVMQRFWDVVGVADEGSVEERQEALAQVRNATKLRASRAAITRLDEVLEWLLKIERPHHRKAVMARMLVHPVSERPVHSWGQIAKVLGTNRSTVRRWYEGGVKAILETLAEAA